MSRQNDQRRGSEAESALQRRTIAYMLRQERLRKNGGASCSGNARRARVRTVGIFFLNWKDAHCTLLAHWV
jgi:hypothetical protein